MPHPILASKAIGIVEEVIDRISRIFDDLPAELQRWLDAHYQRFRTAFAEADSDYAQGAAAAAFLEAVAQVEALAPVVRDLIDSARGRVMRGESVTGDADLLNRLPPVLSLPRAAAAPPQAVAPAPMPPVAQPAPQPRPVPPPAAAPAPSAPQPPTSGEPPSRGSVIGTLVDGALSGASDLAESARRTFRSLRSREEETRTRPPVMSRGEGDGWLGEPVGSGAPDELPAESGGADSAAPPVTRADGETAEPAAQPLTRYPNLDCQDQAIIKQRMSLYIQLLADAPTPDATPLGPIYFEDTEPSELPEIEAVIRARGFDIEGGGDTRVLKVNRSGDTEERVVLVPRKLGEQDIRVDFYQKGRYLGTHQRNVRVVEQVTAVDVVQPESPPAIQIRMVSGLTPPDVELRVIVDRHNPRTLYFEVNSSKDTIGYNHASMGEVTLQNTPQEMFQSIYTELTAFARTTPQTPEDAAAQQRRLARLGNQLWSDLFPPELQAAYWRVKDRIQTVQITSDEPWIPWEIAKPFRFDENDTRIDAPFLCEQFDTARWLAGPGPADMVSVSRVRPIAPATTNLQSVQAELQFLERINQLRPGLIPETPYNDVMRVLDLLENGSFNVLHVAAHGNFDGATPDNSGIMLTGGSLRPSDIVARFGGARPRPLIFINACHGARAAYGLTGLGGWADRLVRRSGVAAFVGAAWEVTDRLALLFAESFYESLIRDGKPIAEAFRIARQRIRDAEPHNSTWLAYVLYADPNACVEIV